MRFHALVLSVAVLLFGIVYTAPHEQAYAQSSGAPPGMGSVLGDVIEATLEAQGYSATDAVVAATIAAVGAQAASVAATVAAGAGTTAGAVSWIAVGAAAGLGTVLGAVPTQLGDDSLQAWQFNSGGTVTVSQLSGSGGSTPSFPAISTGGTVWCFDGTPYSPNQDTGCGGTVSAAGQAEAQARTSSTTNVTVNSCDSGGCSFEYYLNGVDNGPGSMTANSFSDYTGSACSTGLMVGTTGCTGYVNTTPGASSSAPVTESASAAAANTPSSDDSDGLNPVILAGLANALWQQAAEQSGYTGVPYPATAPVTSTDAGNVESSLGSSAPTVGSAVTGAGSLTGASSSSPFAVTAPSGTSTGTSTGASGTTGTGTDGTPDLCQLDPTAAACATLGSASAPSLPTSSVSVSLSPVSVGGPSNATCPASVPVVVFGQTLYFDYTPLCNFVIGLQPLVLALCGLGAGLIIVLGLKS
jgi:hypothetical protein